jgi:hypothetical protein
MSNNDEWNIESYTNTFTNRAQCQPLVFNRLKDCNWHCRDCAGKGIDSKQYAGGGGIQGLQRGTKTRPGLVIESGNAECVDCHKIVTCDRWTGEYKVANPASSIPKSLQTKIYVHYGYIDTIEQRERQAHDLVIDHRFPMKRWGSAEDHNSPSMTSDEIQAKFQLLKKDSTGNHNLLKSRACERCIRTGKRGYPMGIKFYYEGDEDWSEDCPVSGPEAKRGCIGCGWYDFAKWRQALNELIVQTNSDIE